MAAFDYVAVDAGGRTVTGAVTAADEPAARSLLEHGTWLASRGRGEEAEAALGESGTIFAALGATPWLERVKAARGATSSPAA